MVSQNLQMLRYRTLEYAQFKSEEHVVNLVVFMVTEDLGTHFLLLSLRKLEENNLNIFTIILLAQDNGSVGG